MAELFLQARMRMVPIGSAVIEVPAIGEGFARLDARKCDARDPVHIERDEQPMPVNGCVFFKLIGDIYCDVIALAKPHERTWQRAIDAGRHPGAAIHTNGKLVDCQIKLRAGQGGEAKIALICRARPGGQQTGGAKRCARAERCFNERSSGKHV